MAKAKQASETEVVDAPPIVPAVEEAAVASEPAPEAAPPEAAPEPAPAPRKNVAVEMLDADETPVAVIHSMVSHDKWPGPDEAPPTFKPGFDHGVFINGPKKDGTGLAGAHGSAASKVVNATRETLRAKFGGRKPSSIEIVSELPKVNPNRFRLQTPPPEPSE